MKNSFEVNSVVQNVIGKKYNEFRLLLNLY